MSVEFQGGGDSLWGVTPFFLSARRHHRFPARDLSVGSWHGSGSMGSAQSGIRVRGIPWSRAPESQGVRLAVVLGRGGGSGGGRPPLHATSDTARASLWSRRTASRWGVALGRRRSRRGRWIRLCQCWHSYHSTVAKTAFVTQSMKFGALPSTAARNERHGSSTRASHTRRPAHRHKCSQTSCTQPVTFTQRGSRQSSSPCTAPCWWRHDRFSPPH